MKAFICDRCGKAFTEITINVPTVAIRYNKDGNVRDVADLCDSCVDELEQWFNGEEIKCEKTSTVTVKCSC